MGCQADPSDVMTLQTVLQTWIITALREPEALGHLVEDPAVLKNSCLDLCVDRNGIVLEYRKI